jgi:hypothetical protein
VNITVLWYSVTRLDNSVNGNPRYILHTDNGPYITQTDAALGYEIGNLRNRIPAKGAMEVTLHLSETGKVWDIVELRLIEDDPEDEWDIDPAYEDDDQRLGGNDNPYPED